MFAGKLWVSFALIALALLIGPARAQYNYPLTVGTSPTAVLTANPARKRLVFINPSATATIAFCPTQVRSAVVACAVNGAGSITLLPYATYTIDTLRVRRRPTTRWPTPLRRKSPFWNLNKERRMSDIEAGFVLTIARSSGSFGETASAERAEVVYLLRAAAQEIGSGKPAGKLLCRNGHVAGEYRFGSDFICGPGTSFNREHMHRPPAHVGVPHGQPVKRKPLNDGGGKITHSFGEGVMPPLGRTANDSEGAA